MPNRILYWQFDANIAKVSAKTSCLFDCFAETRLDVV